MCRICHGGDEDEPLMVTCRCTGTVKYAHQNCVLNWISKSGNQYCELCKYKYKTKRKKIKSLWKWQFPSVSTKGWLHIGLFIAFVTMLLTSITWIVWSRVSSTPTAVAERTTDEVKFAYMLNGLFIALAIGGLYFDSYRHVRRYFQRWSVLNRHMIIEPYCDQDSLTERTVSSLKTAVSIEQRPGSEASIAIDIAEGPTEPREKQQQNKSKRGNGTWV
ncbi:predicted protein [Nematostella vectensis]|uniref:RING-type E3 ubiquitin transferase n=2 Tax=Nematostella vectensis TaxID=45351 RepID=A7SG91_NEMVE|nr:predicted protein [Nematostella vectensis]|eukprot:XP_001629335.1 predicted protein [Nematostella vectensis]